MGRNFTGSTANYIECTPGFAFSVGVSFSCWVKVPNLDTDNALCGYYRCTTATGGFELGIAAGGTPQFRVWGATGTALASAASPVTAGTWHHICGTSSSSTNRICYRNGTAGSTNTTSRVPSMNTTDDRCTVGVRHISNAYSIPATGDIADVCLWNRALTATEVARLATGIRPVSLVQLTAEWWLPLGGADSPEPDWSGGFRAYSFKNGTITGTVNPSATHPPIHSPLPRLRR